MQNHLSSETKFGPTHLISSRSVRRINDSSIDPNHLAQYPEKQGLVNKLKIKVKKNLPKDQLEWRWDLRPSKCSDQDWYWRNSDPFPSNFCHMDNIRLHSSASPNPNRSNLASCETWERVVEIEDFAASSARWASIGSGTDRTMRPSIKIKRS